jgi:hypothetical protein
LVKALGEALRQHLVDLVENDDLHAVDGKMVSLHHVVNSTGGPEGDRHTTLLHTFHVDRPALEKVTPVGAQAVLEKQCVRFLSPFAG